MTSLKISSRKHIPNLFTMLNLISGCIAILLSFHDLALAGVMILLGGFFDFCDGLAARLLDAYSDFGKELDSLADMVSFGVAPSFILFHLLTMSLVLKDPLFSFNTMGGIEIIILSTSIMPAMFAAIRLARFNLSGSKEECFSGLPSPAAGIFIASVGYILFTSDAVWIRSLILNPGTLLAMNIILSLLMVLPLPMFTVKFKNFSFTENRIRYLYLLPSFFLLVLQGVKAIPLIIIFYILISLTVKILSRKKSGQAQEENN